MVCGDCWLQTYNALVHETIKEPQLPKHERGLDVTLRVTWCAGRISAMYVCTHVHVHVMVITQSHVMYLHVHVHACLYMYMYM